MNKVHLKLFPVPLHLVYDWLHKAREDSLNWAGLTLIILRAAMRCKSSTGTSVEGSRPVLKVIGE